MFVNLTVIRVPLDKLSILRELLEAHYLAAARQQPGYVRSYLLEQIDDATRAQLVQVWESQAALETFRQTGAAERANRILHDQIPALEMQSQGYIVRMQPDEARAAS